jgi:hypothetical protein
MDNVIYFLERIPPEDAENIRMRAYARHRQRCHYLHTERTKKQAELREQCQEKTDHQDSE